MNTVASIALFMQVFWERNGRLIMYTALVTLVVIVTLCMLAAFFLTLDAAWGI